MPETWNSPETYLYHLTCQLLAAESSIPPVKQLSLSSLLHPPPSLWITPVTSPPIAKQPLSTHPAPVLASRQRLSTLSCPSPEMNFSNFKSDQDLPPVQFSGIFHSHRIKGKLFIMIYNAKSHRIHFPFLVLTKHRFCPELLNSSLVILKFGEHNGYPACHCAHATCVHARGFIQLPHLAPLTLYNTSAVWSFLEPSIPPALCLLPADVGGIILRQTMLTLTQASLICFLSVFSFSWKRQ